jgi:radical SAM superfamily enzyme YgiQ (UPF0313 family)
MKNIVLISLPKIETIFPPGALAVLSSVAKENGYTPKILDYNLDILSVLSEEEWGQFESWCIFATDEIPQYIETIVKNVFISKLEKLIDENTKFVCFSCFSYFSNRIAEKVLNWYQENFSIPSVIGGNGISTDVSSINKEFFGDYLMENNLCDYVIFGEGEHTFHELLNDNFEYPGINKNNPIQIEDLSGLPLPDYSYFDMSRYQNNKILITGSRGCVRNCTFCDIELTWPKFRFRDAAHIVAEIKKNYYEYGITNFEFTDSLINGSISNFDKFNELLYTEREKNPGMQEIKYQGQFICRANQQERSYELMHLAGCSMLTVGIESFSNNVRTHMRKKFSNDDIDYHFHQSARWAIPNTILMIVGYPTETLDDHRENIHALYKYKKYSDMGVIFMIRWGYTMFLYRNTPLVGMADELQLSSSDGIDLNSLYDWHSNLNPSNTLKERIRRRIELHELSYTLGYAMPRTREELLNILRIAERVKENKIKSKKVIQLVKE